MKLLAIFLLISAVFCASDSDNTWVNSRYHNIGAHWGVFAGIVIFICCVQLIGLGIEVWYKKKLNNFLELEKVDDEAYYRNN